MKIDGWHIDGYGVHHDLAVADLSDGLTIVGGPNEAGKTTLQHFLVGMLFGFTPSNRSDHHAPLRGGAYGGRLFVTDDDGRSFTIHRSGRRSSLRVTDGDGPVADPEDEVRRLLGGATKDLYQSLFAVHTDELDDLKALTDDQVRDRVFSAGILGAGRTAQAALGQLSSERDELWKPGGRSADKYALKRLRLEVTEARAQLAEARRQSSGLAGLVHRIGVLEADRDRERARRADLHDQRSLLFKVSNQWPTWAEAAEARGALDQLGVIAPVPADAAASLQHLIDRRNEAADLLADDAAELAEATAVIEGLATPGPALAHSDAIAEVAASLGVEQARAAELPTLEDAAARSERELTATLESIGPDADETWLAAHPVDAAAATTLRTAAGEVHTALQHRAAVASTADRAEADHDEAVAELAVREAALAQRTAHPIDRARAAVEAASELSTLLGQREVLAQSIAVAQRPVPGPPPSVLPGFLVPVLVGAAALTTGGGAAAAASGTPVVGAGLVVLGLLLLAVALAAHRSATTAPAPAAPTAAPSELAHQIAELDRAIRPLLDTFKLAERPTLVEASNLRIRADQLAAEATRLDHDRAEAAERRAVLDDRGQRLRARRTADEQAAEVALTEARTRWAAWLSEHGLPAGLDAASAAELLETIGRAHALLRTTRARRADLERATQAADAYAERVRLLLTSTGLATAADPQVRPLDAIAELEAARHAAHADRHALDQAEVAQRAAQRQHDRAQVRAEQADAALTTLLGELGATTIEDARTRIDRAELATTLRRRITQADRDLATSIGPDPARLDAARALLTRADPPRWARELEGFDHQLLGLDDQIDDLTTELAHRNQERDQLERSADVARAELRVADLEAQLVDAVTRWATLSTAHRLVEETLARYQRERQPDVVKRAAAHFAQVTNGRYQRLEVRDQEVVAIDHAEREVRADQLSKGATQQLYLCMRFALAESYARTTRLPLLLDDITVHTDDGRLPRLADTVAAVAADHQVLVFTSHESTVAQLQAASPEARVLTLDPSSTAARRLGIAAS